MVNVDAAMLVLIEHRKARYVAASRTPGSGSYTPLGDRVWIAPLPRFEAGTSLLLDQLN